MRRSSRQAGGRRKAISGGFRGGPRVPVETVVTFGVPANSIIELAKEKGVDMIVMGGHGQSGVTKFIIGSVVKNVLYRATVPVLVVTVIGGIGEDAFWAALTPSGRSIATSSSGGALASRPRAVPRAHAMPLA